ncbi:MAG: hypothetical protein U0132_24135 [Gemmatimonadaceae bacterium]
MMQTVVSPRSANPFTSLFRHRRPLVFLASLFFAATVASGTAVRWMTPPAPVYAACHAANGNCTPNDKTAVADVAYYIPGGSSVTAVEPNSATSWSMTAYWGQAAGGGANCDDHVSAATVDVTWNGSNWVASSFVASADGHVNAVGVCALVTCGSHSSSYRLYVNVDDPIIIAGNPYNLRQVIFAATSVPTGTDHDGTCTAGSSHSPTSGPFGGMDSGGFECTFDCNQTGTNVNITYN